MEEKYISAFHYHLTQITNNLPVFYNFQFKFIWQNFNKDYFFLQIHLLLNLIILRNMVSMFGSSAIHQDLVHSKHFCLCYKTISAQDLWYYFCINECVQVIKFTVFYLTAEMYVLKLNKYNLKILVSVNSFVDTNNMIMK